MPSREEARAEGADLGLEGAELATYVDSRVGKAAPPRPAPARAPRPAPPADTPKVFVPVEEPMGPVQADPYGSRGEMGPFEAPPPRPVPPPSPSYGGMVGAPLWYAPMAAGGTQVASVNPDVVVTPPSLRVSGDGVSASLPSVRVVNRPPVAPSRVESVPAPPSAPPAAAQPLPPPTEQEMIAIILAANPEVSPDAYQRLIRAGRDIRKDYEKALPVVAAMQ